MKAAVQRAQIEPKDINDALIGNVLAELGFAKTGRMALNHAGFPNSTTFHTVNRQCSSSLQAITHIAHSIMVGQIDVGLAGGVESMSRNYGSRGIPTDVSPTLLGSNVKDARDCLMPMGITSENVADRYQVDRKSQDEYAVQSHARASRAQKEGRFDWEIVPVTVPRANDGTGQTSELEVTKDDGIKHGLTYEKVSTLKPVFGENGKSTAGNSYANSSLLINVTDFSGPKYQMEHHPRFWLEGRGQMNADSSHSGGLLVPKSKVAHLMRWALGRFLRSQRC